MKRRIAREKTIQTLFQIDVADTDRQEALEATLYDEPTDPFLEQLVYGVTDHLDTVDRAISKHLEHWTLSRIANVDRAILRLATYEMLFEDDIPVNVTLNEAVELAKAFGEEKSAPFINGILSSISQSNHEKE